MGLVYNKNLFQQAGLDPNNPPKTWADVRAAAKKIAALGNGIAGYSRVQRRQHRRLALHRRAVLAGRPGARRADGKKADFNNARASRSCRTSRTCGTATTAWAPSSCCSGRDLLTNAGAGKVGMFIGAPDATTAIVTQFQGKYEDWAMAPMPGQDGAAKGTLGGGEGYFFKKGLTAEQVKAGLKWIAFEKLTPGKGQFDYARAKPQNQPVGLPQPLLFTDGSDAQKQELDLRKANANVDRRRTSRSSRRPRSPIKGRAAERAGDLRGARRARCPGC